MQLINCQTAFGNVCRVVHFPFWADSGVCETIAFEDSAVVLR